MTLSENFAPLNESNDIKNTEPNTKKEYIPFVNKESQNEPPYTIEETFRSITVNFGDFRLSLDNGTERDKNGKIIDDGKPCIIHSNEGLMYPEDIAQMGLPDSPYPPTGNKLADAFLTTLNFYLTTYYGKQQKLSNEEVNSIVEQAKIWTKNDI